MEATLDATLSYVYQRKQFGQYIGDFQLMQGEHTIDARHSVGSREIG